MKKLTAILAAVLFLMPLTLQAQDGPSASINIKAYSHNELHHDGVETETSGGLDVVGVGVIVYLEATASEAITTEEWTITGPEGSAVTAVEANDSVGFVFFRPDVEGLYEVALTVTTESGTANDSQEIRAADWVGVGAQWGLDGDVSAGQCFVCHSSATVGWAETGHADSWAEKLDGISSHFSYSCVECHVVGWNEHEMAVNGGYDDVAAELGWTFPETLQPGNWDSLVENFPALAHKSNVQCENCHGPGSLHKGDVNYTAVSFDVGVCGQCHGEDPYHRTVDQWQSSGHSAMSAYAAGREGCADCHSGTGFVAMVDPEAGIEQTTGFPQVTCQVCHDPHGNGYSHQVRTLDDVELASGDVINQGGSGKLCMNCHQGRRDAKTYVLQYSGHYGPHYSNQTDMLFGLNAVDFGLPMGNSTHFAAVENTCVGCHMSATPASEEEGMDMLGEHSFAMSYENAEGVIVDHVSSCVPCHGEIESFDGIMARQDYDGDGATESAKAELSGLMHNLGVLLPPYGEETVTVSEEYNSIELKAAFNYIYVEDDYSHGMHNFQFAKSILEVAIEALTYGILTEGEIVRVMDVPNDQGKMVTLGWSRFGGDGVSDNPVVEYAAFRLDEAYHGRKNVQLFESFDAVPSSALKIGDQVEDGHLYWTYVGGVPAVADMQYNLVVPTLEDSTDMGMHYTTFKVAAITKVPTGENYVTAPDSGYSVDNLRPHPPTGPMAAVEGQAVRLQWEESLSEDFNYFAIYRGTEAGFTPSAENMIATTSEISYIDAAVEMDNSYYYRLSAFDFSGNESPYSDEIDAVLVGVADGMSAVPTEFDLFNNYPNPFNPSTSIRFAVPQASNVKVTVYDALGNTVDILVNRHMSAGYHTVNWNASGYVSGVYIYRMEADNFTSVKKMLLVK